MNALVRLGMSPLGRLVSKPILDWRESPDTAETRPANLNNIVNIDEVIVESTSTPLVEATGDTMRENLRPLAAILTFSQIRDH